jgi:hypothetical protein
MMWIVKDSVDIHAYMQCTQGMRLKIVKKKRGDDASMERRRYVRNNKRDKLSKYPERASTGSLYPWP